MSETSSQRAALRGRPFFWVAAVLAFAAVLFFLRERRPPGVLIVTIDTLRADALNGMDTPAMLELATRGTRFLRARTPVPLTLPAHATLLTGLEPPVHGIRGNSAAPVPDRVTLLAEEFRDAGYATAAFLASSVLDPRYRLDRGFSEYRHPPRQVRGSPSFNFRPAPEQLARVAAWFQVRPKERPFFVWVHLWDPHAPYLPYAGDARGRRGTVASDPVAERYRGEVCRADAAVEEILKLVDLETTIVVLASDHGESLGEHGEASHGHLCYGTTLDVPLMLAGPGVPAGAEERRVCSLADVAPTLRKLVGLEPRDSDGFDLLDLPDARVVLGESLYAYRLYRWAQQSVAYDGSFSLLDGGPRLELFDRDADPGERAALARPQERPVYERLDRALLGYRRRRAPGELGTEVAPPVQYYGTPFIPAPDFLPAAENLALPDVVAMMPALGLLDLARAAIETGDASRVAPLVARLAELEERDPGNPAPALVRGRALLLVLKRPQEAAAAIEEARRRGYETPDVAALLARAYDEAGDAAAAARLRAGKKRPR